MSLHLADLPTPALLLDRGRLLTNLEAMRARISARGVALRPHLKTAKSAKVAELATEGASGGITVSTLREAEYFFDHGFRDITYAVGIVPARLGRVAALQDKGARVQILTDNLTAAGQIAQYAQAHDASFRVLVEIDTGDRRAGLLPDSPDLLDVAGALHAAPGVELLGVLTHAGQSYDCGSIAEVRAVAELERDGVVAAARRLRDAGLPCPVVSAGSTPTAVHADDLTGVTEMRPGCYMFFDLDQLVLGSCARDDLALSVLTTVIGHNRHAGHLLLDAGALALSKDVSATRWRPEVGYGEVCDPASLTPYPGLFVGSVNQEHGVVPVTDPEAFARLPVGSQVRVLPNHACMTAAAYERYLVVEDGAVIDDWDRVNGW
jgi:D-serine deaminase-like pyridoxal phosphate-dependent protein